MNEHKIACCYFPTTVMFVDDNEGYLNSLTPRLHKKLICRFETNQLKALEFLNRNCNPTTYINKWLSNLKDSTMDLGCELEQNESTHSYIDIDINEIHKEIYSASRFSEISVLVVDYAMPKMNGLEFCKHLKNLPIKKLILTGQAGFDLGVNALNDGLIDKFIIKDTSGDFRTSLNSAIDDLQHKYFSDLSATVIENLATSARCALGDTEFSTFFNNFCIENSIAEYYLVKDTGSMLLLDIDGNPSWLAVESEEGMKNYTDFVEDSGGPADIIESLKMRNKIIFLLNRDDEYIKSDNDWNKWRKCLHPAQKLIGKKNTYYYAHIPKILNNGINLNQIANYRDFLIKN